MISIRLVLSVLINSLRLSPHLTDNTIEFREFAADLGRLVSNAWPRNFACARFL